MSVPVTTYFTYDNRGRLTREIRTGTVPYALLYEYDKGGNRKRKVDVLNEIEMLYEYDVDNVAIYGTANNRLRHYITCDMSAADAVCDPDSLTPALVSHTLYHYNDVGNVTRVIIFRWNPEPGERQVTATRFVYARNGTTVSYVIGEAWDEVPPESCDDNYEIRYAREYRYDGARQRYLVRDLKTSSLELGNVVDTSPPSRVWSDYDGDSIYGDFTVDGTTLTQTAIYEPGIARSFGPDNVFATEYYHADALGTTRLMTQGFGASLNVVSESSYTAFGEQVGGAAQRYGYAGAWGYQTATSDTPGDAYATDFQFMHVGARYYDTATGRFLQRDPIGIFGGLNAYAYVENSPLSGVDPSGFATTLNPPALAGAGFTAKEIAIILACTAVGAKAWDEWKKHTDGVERGEDLVRRLKELQKGLKKKRHRDAADKAIREETKKIKGHKKEIKQKWPNGEPPKPAG